MYYVLPPSSQKWRVTYHKYWNVYSFGSHFHSFSKPSFGYSGGGMTSDVWLTFGGMLGRCLILGSFT
ncbi:unnamed protein product [Schistosoma mattheei]|uniref:Uncharacterized protein n=1 Tax=Schistosoma mattheei TaxID=31246 RepID=A0A183PPB3_9TREM|nr:unnamed protein product [Schistosoma mattheei]